MALGQNHNLTWSDKMPEQTQEPKPKLYNLSFTKDEIVERIRTLSKSENIEVYMKVKKGEAEYTELQQLIQLIGNEAN
jgi:hypothetical protein